MNTVSIEQNNLQGSQEPSIHSEFNRQIHPAEEQSFNFDEVNDSQPNMIFDKESPMSQKGAFDLLKNQVRVTVEPQIEEKGNNLIIHPTQKEVYSSFAEINDLNSGNLIFDQISHGSYKNSEAESTVRIDLLAPYMAKPVPIRSQNTVPIRLSKNSRLVAQDDDQPMIIPNHLAQATAIQKQFNNEYAYDGFSVVKDHLTKDYISQAKKELNASTNTMNKEVTKRTAGTQFSAILPIQAQPVPVVTEPVVSLVRQPPQFSQEIKQIREQLQNHYEVQIKGLLEEIHAQKKCLELSYLEKYKQQVQEHGVIVQKLLAKDNLRQQEINSLKSQILKGEDYVKSLKSELSDLKNQKETLNGTIKRSENSASLLQSQIETMLGYMTGLKQTNENLYFELRKTQDQLNFLQQKDLAASAKILRLECETLRSNQLTQSQNLTHFQNSLKAAIQTTNCGNSHFQTLLEQQSSELVNLRSQLTEYERRESGCVRKWNALIQENTQLQQSIQETEHQMLKQRTQFQTSINQVERNLLEANRRLAMSHLSDQEKKESAQFLVHQVRLLQDDKQTLLKDNQELSLQLIQKREGNSENVGADSKQQRIDELQDQVHELKINNSVQELLSQREVIVRQAAENANLAQLMKEFREKKVRAQDLFGENELFVNFKKLMTEKDNLIQTLMVQQSKPLAATFRNTFESQENIQVPSKSMTDALLQFDLNASHHESKSHSRPATSAMGLYGVSERDNWIANSSERI